MSDIHSGLFQMYELFSVDKILQTIYNLFDQNLWSSMSHSVLRLVTLNICTSLNMFLNRAIYV